MSNEELDSQLYKYPNSDVLRNKLNIRDHAALSETERRLVTDRIVESVPAGNFDLEHLQTIHKHLFQDIYDWAGDIRQVQIHKGDSVFMPPKKIESAMQYVHTQLKDQNYLQDLNQEDFSKKAGIVLGDVNHIHPFREGNGRTQFQYLKQLGERAGYKIDLSCFDRDDWIKASIEANRVEYNRMQECIHNAIAGCMELHKGRAKDTHKGRESKEI
ncbi:MAG: Fic family protein [Alphaproteobacteria bacterium]|nr:Fic family protein [Alphaproteobacteria bacterium]